jgi:hypothetical protein
MRWPAVVEETMSRSFTLLLFVLAAVTGCPSEGGQSPQPDAAPPRPDAAPPPPPPPPPPPLKVFGESCVSPSECQSGLCVGDGPGTFICSRLCSLAVALDCKDVDAFCVPIGSGDNACFGEIESGNDLDDAILEIGDSATRSLTPLADADVFQVRLNQLGTVVFEATGSASIDVQLEGYGVLGDALGTANDTAGGAAESLQTEVQQIGTHLFIVVRNVGNSTGNYTLRVFRETTANARALPPVRVDQNKIDAASDAVMPF